MCAATDADGSGHQHSSQCKVIVFLDIDGVLHSLYGKEFFRPTCMHHLDRILRTSGASVVLSSTWRNVPKKYDMVNDMLRVRGLPVVFDVTKDLNSKGDTGKKHVPREVEICEWLDRHPEVQRWIAIDDMQLMNPETKEGQRMKGHFVRTNCNSGLITEDADLALRLLGVDPNENANDSPLIQSSEKNIDSSNEATFASLHKVVELGGHNVHGYSSMVGKSGLPACSPEIPMGPERASLGSAMSLCSGAEAAVRMTSTAPQTPSKDPGKTMEQIPIEFSDPEKQAQAVPGNSASKQSCQPFHDDLSPMSPQQQVSAPVVPLRVAPYVRVDTGPVPPSAPPEGDSQLTMGPVEGQPLPLQYPQHLQSPQHLGEKYPKLLQHPKSPQFAQQHDTYYPQQYPQQSPKQYPQNSPYPSFQHAGSNVHSLGGGRPLSMCAQRNGNIPSSPASPQYMMIRKA